jgi:hypothetical protein
VRKRQIAPNILTEPPSGQVWLDIDRIASVEVTSEEDGYPIEPTLIGTENPGWRAANPGTQTIRLVFDEPQTLKRIWLVFEDIEHTRTQEFVLRWTQAGNIRFEKSYAKNGISALTVQCGKSRTMLSSSPTLWCLS